MRTMLGRRRPDDLTGHELLSSDASHATTVLMHGWADGPTIDSGGQRWDVTKLGQQTRD